MPNPIDAQSIRDASLDALERAGFRPARWLPLPDADAQLRPTREIAARVLALNGLFAWVVAPDAAVSDSRLMQFFGQSALTPTLNDWEKDALKAPTRDIARAHWSETIGWKLENMWPLSWVTGWDEQPHARGEFIANEVSDAMMRDFLPDFDATIDDFTGNVQVRSVAEVVALEDLFYCAHNAARSAQLGEATVPTGFHPIRDGGVIHERRHALTWCLSPGVAWDETDLST